MNGMDFTGSLFSTGLSLYGMEHQSWENEQQRQWASKEAEKARKENYEYNELAAQNADARQRAQFADLYSPTAQMKLLQEAGLSPSLMYGGTPSPGGQATGQQGGGANGPGPISPQIFSEVAAGAALAESISRAKLNTAEANAINQKTPVQIQEILSSIGLKDASTNLTKAETITQELTNWLKDKSKGYELAKCASEMEKTSYDADKAFWEARNKEIEFNFANDTYNDRVEQIVQNNKLIASEILLNEAKKDLSYSQSAEARAHIDRMISQTWIDWKNTDIHEAEQQAQQKWFEAQAENLVNKLAQDLAINTWHLNNETKQMILKTITDVLSTMCHSASMLYVGAGTQAIKNNQPKQGVPYGQQNPGPIIYY